MTVSRSVEEYVAMQHRFRWRRQMLRNLIRTVGFGIIVRATITGLENIPDSGPTLLMMNHISLLDPILCMGGITNRFVIPMTKVENMRNPIVGPFARWWGSYSVNRGEVDREALNNSIELLKSGQLILIAPEGTRQREGLTQPKDGLTYIATKADAVIVPAAISGAVGWMDELKHLKRPVVSLNFGKPFKFKTDGRKRIPREELSSMTDEAMYQLSMAVTDTSMRGVYSDLSQATTNYLEFITP